VPKSVAFCEERLVSKFDTNADAFGNVLHTPVYEHRYTKSFSIHFVMDVPYQILFEAVNVYSTERRCSRDVT
jgi:hypothetical protein